MCDVAAIATTGLSIGSSVAGMFGQQSAATAQAKYQNNLYAQNATIAMNNYQQTLGQLQLRGQQNIAAAGQEALQNQITTGNAMSRAVTAAGEAGVTGNSAHELLNTFSQHEAMNNDALHQNLYWSQLQQNQQALAARSAAMGQIASATPKPVERPNYLGAGLQIGTSILGGFNSFAMSQPNNGMDTAIGNLLFKPLF